MIVKVPTGFEDLQATGKIDVIREMVGLLVMNSLLPESLKDLAVKTISDREALGTTGIMNGVAVPHAKLEGIEELICCVGRSSKGVDYEALDSNPTFVFFLLISPKKRPGDHLETLVKFSNLLREDKIIKEIREAENVDKILAIMNEI